MFKYILIFLLCFKKTDSFSFPQLKTLWEGTNILPLWLPVIREEQVTEKPRLIKIYDEPFAVYRNNENSIVIIYDKCPHQGASLSSGKINNNCLICPYHSFGFKNGKLCKMSSSQEFRSVKGVPRLKTKIINNLVYVNPFYDLNNIDIINNYKIPPPYMPPEHYDDRFRKISGERIINKNAEIVTENILDMLHISTVHSFGNMNSPLPYDIKYHDIDIFSGKTKFKYKSGNFSISRRVALQPEVIVENEYHLPTTTITRVIANDLVKVVMTNILPISEDQSIMYWTVYRNFWIYPIPQIGDIVMKYFMDKTIDEDIAILKNVYSKDRIGNIDTRYDITINKYRNAKRIFRDNL